MLISLSTFYFLCVAGVTGAGAFAMFSYYVSLKRILRASMLSKLEKIPEVDPLGLMSIPPPPPLDLTVSLPPPPTLNTIKTLEPPIEAKPFITYPDGTEPTEPEPFTSSKTFRIAGAVGGVLLGLLIYLLIR